MLQVRLHRPLLPLPALTLKHSDNIHGLLLVIVIITAIYSWFTDRMSYGERVLNLVFTLMMKKYFIAGIFAAENQFFRRKFGDRFIDLNVCFPKFLKSGY